MNRQFVSFCSIVALMGNSFAAFAQNPVPDKAKTEQRITIIQNDQTVSTDGNVKFAKTVSPSDILMSQGSGLMQGSTFQMSYENKLVKGKPYSADAVQENIQILGDGNRIVNRTISSVARDSEGRNRQEISIAFGPLAGAMGKAPKIISITDPVSGNNFMLHPEDKTVVKMPSIQIFSQVATVPRSEASKGETFQTRIAEPGMQRVAGGVLVAKAVNRVQPKYPAEAKAAGVAGAVQVAVTVDETGNVTRAEAVGGPEALREAAVDAARQWQFKSTELAGKAVKIQGIVTFNFTLADSPKKETVEREVTVKSLGSLPGAMRLEMNGDNFKFFNTSKYESKKEDLGTQTIEGLVCTGKREITTIPVGDVSNELPINIVSESWYSADLDTTVLRKFNDPRYGENIYRLTNISRNEPAKDLFEIPSDYTVKEGGGFNSFQFSDGEGKNMKIETRTEQKIIHKEQ